MGPGVLAIAKSPCGESSDLCPGERRFIGEKVGRSLQLAIARIS